MSKPYGQALLVRHDEVFPIGPPVRRSAEAIRGVNSQTQQNEVQRNNVKATFVAGGGA